MLGPTSKFKVIWNILMFLLIVYTAMVVPVRISFVDETTDAWLIADVVMDSLFMIDIFINFISAYEDDSGEIVKSRKRIAISYMKGWFLIDLCSSIPISLIQRFANVSTATSNIKFLKLSRLPRLYKLLRLIKLMRLYRSNKFFEKILNAGGITQVTKQIIKSLLKMIFLIHLLGCLFAIFSSLDDSGPSNWI